MPLSIPSRPRATPPLKSSQNWAADLPRVVRDSREGPGSVNSWRLIMIEPKFWPVCCRKFSKFTQTQQDAKVVVQCTHHISDCVERQCATACQLRNWTSSFVSGERRCQTLEQRPKIFSRPRRRLKVRCSISCIRETFLNIAFAQRFMKSLAFSIPAWIAKRFQFSSDCVNVVSTPKRSQPL